MLKVTWYSHPANDLSYEISNTKVLLQIQTNWIFNIKNDKNTSFKFDNVFRYLFIPRQILISQIFVQSIHINVRAHYHKYQISNILLVSILINQMYEIWDGFPSLVLWSYRGAEVGSGVELGADLSVRFVWAKIKTVTYQHISTP